MNALKPNNVNLYAKFHENPEKAARTKKRVYMTVPIVFIVFTLVGVSVWMYTIVNFLKTQLDMYMAEVESMSDEYKEKSDIDYRTHTFTLENEALSEIKASVDSYPELSSSMFKTITDSVTGYDDKMFLYDMNYTADNGTLTLTMGTTDVTLAPEMVRKLLDTGLFMDVSHVGYTIREGFIDEDGTIVPDEYSFTVYCVMNIGEEK